MVKKIAITAVVLIVVSVAWAFVQGVLLQSNAGFTLGWLSLAFLWIVAIGGCRAFLAD